MNHPVSPRRSVTFRIAAAIARPLCLDFSRAPDRPAAYVPALLLHISVFALLLVVSFLFFFLSHCTHCLIELLVALQKNIATLRSLLNPVCLVSLFLSWFYKCLRWIVFVFILLTLPSLTHRQLPGLRVGSDAASPMVHLMLATAQPVTAAEHALQRVVDKVNSMEACL